MHLSAHWAFLRDVVVRAVGFGRDMPLNIVIGLGAAIEEGPHIYVEK